ncbi:hypothetical protein EVG20_g7971 [Dentipellis fragilis]|uniref:SUN domain-containing protein n=1 Tax=Dentipellis fragilis TaxID=205917 RepID=A0A4Y9YAL3_9AGAM|nr:hypothetical protein EVG20_g7971 [Dentipellis fragilis]
MHLPFALLALLFAHATLAAPSTPNDLFHALSVLAPRPPEPPICCLKPLTPLEPVDDDIFLSFEEWKARRLAEGTSHKDPQTSTGTNGGHDPATDAAASPQQNASTNPSPAPPHAEVLDNASSSPPHESLSPHFRVPLTDRFNYASLDCSARVHTAHRGAKSVANILSGKKDRYMLSPCAAPRQFVVVELCEDIWIDTVQLANFEFFSGVFKEFTVSVSRTYTTEPEGWTVVGTYMAKNVRGVQSFHPPTSVRDFYRFIRIDFHSHYGNEYYCPISLLRVYGLTHLEQYKWDIWEAESRAKQEQAAPVAIPAEVVEEPPQPEQVPAPVEGSSKTGESLAGTAEATQVASDVHSTSEVSEDPEGYMRHSTDIARSRNPTGETPTSTQGRPPPSIHDPTESSNATLHSSNGSQTPSSTDSSSGQHTISSPNGSTISTTSSVSLSARSEQSSSLSASPSASHSHIQSIPPDSSSKHTELPHQAHASESPFLSHPPSSSASHNASASASTISLSTSTLISLAAPLPPQLPSTGESIYRTIMNRLTALEANNTLYARYVEEQTAGIREVLRRLGEDVGRLEGIGKAQAQVYQRAAQDYERQRRRMEVEQRELITKVNYLADEIVLEKRLGILQLCLLLAVLVFLGLTRGSRSELLEARRGGATMMREWGRRNLSLSGDWVNRFRGRSRSLTPSPGDSTPVAAEGTGDKVRFPSRSAHHAPLNTEKPRQYRGIGIGSGPATPTSSRRSALGSGVPRTPTLRTPRYHGLHQTPGGRPGLQRSNSHGSTSGGHAQGNVVVLNPVPRSARRWARSAHLHEVRRAEGADVVVSPAGKDDGGRHLSPLRVVTNQTLMGEKVKEKEEDAEGWVDTDVEDGGGAAW